MNYSELDIEHLLEIRRFHENYNEDSVSSVEELMKIDAELDRRKICLYDVRAITNGFCVRMQRMLLLVPHAEQIQVRYDSCDNPPHDVEFVGTRQEVMDALNLAGYLTM